MLTLVAEPRQFTMSKSFPNIHKIDVYQALKHYRHILAFIPKGAKKMVLSTFLKEMNLTHPQYYRRVKNPNLWTQEEIYTAVEILKKNGVI